MARSTSDKVVHESKNWFGILVVVFLLFAFAGPLLKACGGSAVTGAAGTGAVGGAAAGVAGCKAFCKGGGGGGAGGGGGSARGSKEDEETAATTEAPTPTPTTPPAPTPPAPEDDEPDDSKARIRPDRGFYLPGPDRSGNSLRPPAGAQWQPMPMPGFQTQ